MHDCVVLLVSLRDVAREHVAARMRLSLRELDRYHADVAEIPVVKAYWTEQSLEPQVFAQLCVLYWRIRLRTWFLLADARLQVDRK